MYKINMHEFGQQDVDVRIFKNVEYNLKDGKIGKGVDLIIESIKVHTFMDDFKIKYQSKYVKHSQHDKWLDNQFHQCRNTFSVGTIVLVVDFVKSYTLEP